MFKYIFSFLTLQYKFIFSSLNVLLILSFAIFLKKSEFLIQMNIFKRENKIFRIRLKNYYINSLHCNFFSHRNKIFMIFKEIGKNILFFLFRAKYFVIDFDDDLFYKFRRRNN